MELEVEVEQMFERLARDGAHRALANVGEHSIQQLAEQRRTYSSTAICPPHAQLTKSSPNIEGVKLPRTSQNNRATDDPHGRLRIKGNIKSVDNFFKKKRDLDVQQLQTTNTRSTMISREEIFF
jgi:hypothetical protein